MKFKTILLDNLSMARATTRISHEIIERNKGVQNVAIVGIVTRGVPIANQIKERINQLEGINVPVGKLDITLYRDDLSELGEVPTINSTQIDFDVNGKDIVLVDDVIYTGRTVRAGIDAIMKLGRPKTIQLAVLIDRGHRELPIRADYVGKNIPTSNDEVVSVKFEEIDGETSVSLYEKN